jgi:two-component system, cell cycle sensor histidine kinase and response regulator CckA
MHLSRLHETPEPLQAKSSSTTLPKGTETILLAEDDSAVRAFASLVLQTLGYRVLEAADGNEALTSMKDHSGSIDLLLTDVVMPYIGGSDLARRAEELFPGTRVLYMSGYTNPASVQGAPLLQKPFTPLALAQTVREILDGPESIDLGIT